MDVKAERINTASFSMRYFNFGNGPDTLVILPGLSVKSVMESANSVAGAYKIFTDDYTVYVFDRREEPFVGYSISDMARDTHEAFEILGLHDVCLFGASQGGMIALSLVLEYPSSVRKLALGSTSPFVDEKQFEKIRRWIGYAERKDGEGLYNDFGECIYPAEIFRKFHGVITSAGNTVTDAEFERFIILANGSENFDVTDKLSSVNIPVLAIGSTDDMVLGSEGMEKIASCFSGRPDFHFHMYTGFGHAVYDIAPDYKKRLMDFFLSE